MYLFNKNMSLNMRWTWAQQNKSQTSNMRRSADPSDARVPLNMQHSSQSVFHIIFSRTAVITDPLRWLASRLLELVQNVCVCV